MLCFPQRKFGFFLYSYSKIDTLAALEATAKKILTVQMSGGGQGVDSAFKTFNLSIAIP